MFVIGMVMLFFYARGFILSYEERSVELYGLEKLIALQEELLENASKPHLIYCKGFTNLSVARGGCDISVDGWRSRNCFYDMMEKSIAYFNSTTITKDNLENKLDEFLAYMPYNCSYEVDITTSCNADRGFRVVCYGNDVETREGIKKVKLVLEGGVS